jgi:hypothetical protein
MKLAKRRISMLLAVSATTMVVAGALAAPAGASPQAPGQDGAHADALISLVDNDRATFGGISFDQKTGTATIRYDDDAGDRAARARLGGLAT